MLTTLGKWCVITTTAAGLLSAPASAQRQPKSSQGTPAPAAASAPASPQLVTVAQAPASACDGFAADRDNQQLVARVKLLSDSLSSLGALSSQVGERLNRARDSLATKIPATESELIKSYQQRVTALQDSSRVLGETQTVLGSERQLSISILTLPRKLTENCQQAAYRDAMASREAAIGIVKSARADLKNIRDGWKNSSSLGGTVSQIYKAGLVVTPAEKAKVASWVTGSSGAVASILGGFAKSDQGRKLGLSSGGVLLAVTSFLTQKHADALNKVVGRIARNTAFADANDRLGDVLARLTATTDSLDQITEPSADAPPTERESALYERALECEREVVDILRAMESVARGLQREGADEPITAGSATTKLGKVIEFAQNTGRQWEGSSRNHRATVAALRTTIPPRPVKPVQADS